MYNIFEIALQNAIFEIVNIVIFCIEMQWQSKMLLPSDRECVIINYVTEIFASLYTYIYNQAGKKNIYIYTKNANMNRNCDTYLYIYIVKQFLLIICRHLINVVVRIMPTLVEIGPSNASQGQHRRKEATK